MLSFQQLLIDKNKHKQEPIQNYSDAHDYYNYYN